MTYSLVSQVQELEPSVVELFVRHKPLLIVYIQQPEGGREGGREAGRQGGREAGREGGRQGGKEERVKRENIEQEDAQKTYQECPH